MLPGGGPGGGGTPIPGGGIPPGGIPPTEEYPDEAPVIISCDPGIIISRSCETKSRVVVVTFSFSLVCSFLI